jgi:hypothetical protein
MWIEVLADCPLLKKKKNMTAIFIKKWYMFGYVTLNSLVYNEIISSADTSGGHNFLFLVIPKPNTCSSDSSTEWI